MHHGPKTMNSQPYTRLSSDHTPERIRTLRGKFHRKQKRRRWFEALGTATGIFAVFLTGVMFGLLIVAGIIYLFKHTS
jgi:hypothetical protein